MSDHATQWIAFAVFCIAVFWILLRMTSPRKRRGQRGGGFDASSWFASIESDSHVHHQDGSGHENGTGHSY